MTKYLGDIAEDATIRGSFNTRSSAGAPITLAGTPAVSVYKDAGATESTAGVTLTVDFDSRTGHHIYTIDTSADAFYATGADYRVVITAGTVDGVSVVGVEVGSFSIQNRSVPSVSLGANAPADWINAAAIAAGALDGKGNWNVGKTGYSLTATTGLGNQTADITGNLSGSVGSVTAPVTVGTNNDKTGYSLSQSFPANFAAMGINASGHLERVVLVDTTTDNTDVTALATNYNATRAGYLDKLNVSGTLAHSDAANTYKADVSGLSTLTATQVWEHATRSLTTFGSLVSDIWSAGSRTLTAIGDSAGVTTLLERILGIIRTAADDVTAEAAQTAANRDGLATATNVSDAQTAIANILGTPSGASIAADIAAIELDPEIIVNPTELSNESIEAIDEYFWENHRFKATIDSETGQFVIWVKNEDGDKIATLAKQEKIIEDIAGIEGGGGASINVLPAVGIVANRAPGVTLQPVVGETISQSITLYATDGTTPINLIGKTLVAVFETLQGIDVATVPNSSIAVGGSSNNVVTFSYPSIVTSAERTLRFALRDAAAPLTMYLQGLCVVTRAPQVDA
jgi:hypothetical protein